MKKLLIILLLLFCNNCYASGFYFAQPVPDTTKIDSASSSSLLHFDGDLNDLASNVWSASGSSFETGIFSEALSSYLATDTASYELMRLSSGFSSFENAGNDFTLEFWIGLDINVLVDTFTSQKIFEFVLSDNSFNIWTFDVSLAEALASQTYKLSLRATGSGGSPYTLTALDPNIYSADGLRWFHICFETISKTLYFYIDGAQIGSGSMFVDWVSLISVNSTVYGSPGIEYNIRKDEFRFTKNGYIYGGPFTPPTQPFGPEIVPAFKFATSGELNLAP